MTRATNARVAGVTFLVYIAAGVAAMALFGRATSGQGIAAKLASLARHATDVRVFVLLTLLTSLSALVLAVTLHAITREEDPDLALLALACRVGEGLIGSLAIPRTLGLLWLATATGADAPGPGAAQALGGYLLRGQAGASFFAIGSTLFAYLLLRGRMVPAVLAWLGVIASVLLVVFLPLQMAGLVGGASTFWAGVGWLVWMPMLVFEVGLAL
ncbi:MAG TPA: DUF4386 domain-containing protein, partial [Thermoanaerobaculia bacterium]|nr:DUF4386 domain-containing protein [Thermoanaerobaculia bacterium]